MRASLSMEGHKSRRVAPHSTQKEVALLIRRGEPHIIHLAGLRAALLSFPGPRSVVYETGGETLNPKKTSLLFEALDCPLPIVRTTTERSRHVLQGAELQALLFPEVLVFFRKEGGKIVAGGDRWIKIRCGSGRRRREGSK